MGGELILAIDTASGHTGVALYAGAVVAELVWRSGPEQTRELVPAINWLLQQRQLAVDDLSAVAVSLGPGSFNGLRVGISTAKAIAFARGLPCYGVGTLEATAHEWGVADRLIRPIQDAGRGEIATALFERSDDGLRTLEEARLATIPALVESIDRPTLICGELRPEWIGLLIAGRSGAVVHPTAAGWARRPAFLAELAWRRLRSGAPADAASLQPIYLRRPAITPPR